MANELSTAGIILYYNADTAASSPTVTHPSGTGTTWTQVHNIKSIPDFNSAPETLDVTDLSDPEYMRSILGLKSTGDSLAFGANFTTQFVTEWQTIISAATSSTAPKQIWWKITVPNFGSFYFAGEPANIGLPALEVNTVFSGDVYIAPNVVEGWELDT